MRATLPAPFVTLAPSTPAPMRSRAPLAGTMGKELGKVAVLRREALGFCDVEVVEKLGSPRRTPLRNGFGESGFEATLAGTNRVALLPSKQPVGFSFQRPDSDSRHAGIPPQEERRTRSEPKLTG